MRQMVVEQLETETATVPAARLFVALGIPEVVREAVRERLGEYEEHIERVIPEERWHMTLFFLGEVAAPGQYVELLSEPLELPFVLTVSIATVGRGQMSDQLWAYVAVTPVIEKLHQRVAERIRDIGVPVRPSYVSEKRRFVPHVRVADLKPSQSRLGIVDVPVGVTFAASHAYVYRSYALAEGVRYVPEGVLYLNA